jgi:hypothetical protein
MAVSLERQTCGHKRYSSLGGAASGTSRPVVDPACSSSPSALGFSSSPLLLLLLELVASGAVDSRAADTDPSLLTFGVVVLAGLGPGFGVDADSLQPTNHSAVPVRIRPERYFFKFAEKRMS